MLRSLLSEPQVRSMLQASFVCAWVLKDDLSRDMQRAPKNELMSELAGMLLGHATELAQIVVVDAEAVANLGLARSASFTASAVRRNVRQAEGVEVEAGDAAGEHEGGASGPIRVYTETGRQASFDRTLGGFLAFLRGSL